MVVVITVPAWNSLLVAVKMACPVASVSRVWLIPVADIVTEISIRAVLLPSWMRNVAVNFFCTSMVVD